LEGNELQTKQLLLNSVAEKIHCAMVAAQLRFGDLSHDPNAGEDLSRRSTAPCAMEKSTFVPLQKDAVCSMQ